MALTFSSKRVQIDKANLNIVIAVSVAAFLLFFSLVACHALLAQRKYQATVIEKKQKAKDTLVADVDNAKKLVDSYKKFVAEPVNVIGGPSMGTGDRDGDNAKIILDALPSKYDFPALTTSLDKILGGQNYKVGSINGTDDEIAQGQSKPSTNPKAVEIPFQVNVETPAAGLQNLFMVFEKSIRPIQFQGVTISATAGSLTVAIDAKTYYQPEKVFEIHSQIVKQDKKK